MSPQTEHHSAQLGLRGWKRQHTTMKRQEQSHAAAASPPVPAHVVQEHVKLQWPHSSSGALLQ